ncbi:MAG: c-type cytochrome [Geminicoccaceae bacterium]
MERLRMLTLLVATAVGFAAILPFGASMADEDELTEEFMANEENIELGRTLFQKRCKFCHGKGAYPGKAPKLKPKKMSAEQVYLRISYGFRAMPGWEHEFDDHERMSLTAYIKSPVFSN